MTTWTDADLARFGDAQEVRVAGHAARRLAANAGDRMGGARRRRAVHPIGQRPDAAWFRGVQVRHRGQISARRHGGWTWTSSTEVMPPTTTIDAAYQRKYGRYPGPVKSITSPPARSTTLKIIPHQPD